MQMNPDFYIISKIVGWFLHAQNNDETQTSVRKDCWKEILKILNRMQSSSLCVISIRSHFFRVKYGKVVIYLVDVNLVLLVELAKMGVVNDNQLQHLWLAIPHGFNRSGLQFVDL